MWLCVSQRCWPMPNSFAHLEPFSLRVICHAELLTGSNRGVPSKRLVATRAIRNGFQTKMHISPAGCKHENQVAKYHKISWIDSCWKWFRNFKSEFPKLLSPNLLRNSGDFRLQYTNRDEPCQASPKLRFHRLQNLLRSVFQGQQLIKFLFGFWIDLWHLHLEGICRIFEVWQNHPRRSAREQHWHRALAHRAGPSWSFFEKNHITWILHGWSLQFLSS